MTLTKQLKQYINKERKFYPPYLWEKWGVEPSVFSTALAEIWNTLSSPAIVDDLVVTQTSNEKWVYEVCNTAYVRGKYIEESQLFDWCKANQKKDQHISVVAHDSNWLNHVKKTGTVGRVQNSKVKLNDLHIELDRKGDADPIGKACTDAFIIKTSSVIAPYATAFFSGNKSVHLHVDGGLFGNPIGKQEKFCGRGKLIYNLQHMIASDVRYGNGVVDVWGLSASKVTELFRKRFGEVFDDVGKMRQYLENCDPNLCSVNSLIRSPFSWHEKGNQQKTILTDEKLLLIDLKGKIADWRVKAPPLLLHWYYEAIKPTYKKKKIACNASESYICKVFETYIDDFDEDEATADGYINGLYSPFYEDENPSVSVNIETGYYKDFGNPEHSFTLAEFLSAIQKIPIHQALKKIEKEEI